MNGLSWLQARGERLAEIARTPLNTPRHLYLTGFALVVLGLVQGGFTGTVWTITWVVGLSIICVGFIQEIWAKIKALLTPAVARAVILALGSTVVTLPSYIWAHQSVNHITGLAPESFPLSVSALAIGYVLPVALMTGALILGAYAFWQVLVLAWYSMRMQLGMITRLFSIAPSTINRERELLHVSRMIAAITLMAVLIYFSDLHDQAEETLQQIRTEVVVHVDYYPRSPCRNVAAQERVAFLKDGKISVATRQAGQWHFRLDSCEAA